ncbi:MAG: choice-of-anchor D domain-containing protein, partial [Candidatus Pacearchaeota archaeon]|nr:choice-of-anchor D domain-containing protein [Candidatus Pacearchaeota archaeon]
TFTQGVVNNGIHLNGSASYVNLPGTIDDNLAEGTLSFWVKRESTVLDQVILAWGDTAPTSDSGKYLAITAASSISGCWEAAFSLAGTTAEQRIIGTQALPLDEWVNITLIFDGTAVSAYLNGHLEGQISNSFTPGALNASRLLLGKSLADNNFFQGSLDELILMSRGASPEEVQKMATVVNILTQDDLVMENGSNYATFEIQRQGYLLNDLSVDVVLGGSALTGIDYELSSLDFTIPANAQNALFYVFPFDDPDLEGNETVIMSLAAGTQYTTGTPFRATVTIDDDESMRLLTASPKTLQYGDVLVNDLVVLEVTLTNDGTEKTTLNNASSDNPEFSIIPELPMEIAPGGSIQLAIQFAPLTSGLQTGTINLNSDAEDNPFLTVYVEGTGYKTAEIAVNPSTFNEIIPKGQSIVKNLLLYNTGDEPLNYSISTGMSSGIANPEDNFGHGWKDSNAALDPIPYVWNEIKATGTRLSISSNDDSSTNVSLPFTFPYYSNSYTSVYVCTNGFVTFGTSASSYSNSTLPYSGAPANILAPFWDDLNPGAQGDIYVQSDSEQMIIQFENVKRYSTSSNLTFQVVLKPSGDIYFYYKAMIGTSLNSATVGMQDYTKTDGFIISYNIDFTCANYAIKISTQEAPWLILNADTGTIAGGQNETIALTVSTTDLTLGDYTTDLTIIHNGQNEESPLIIPVNMTVRGIKSLTSNAASINFGDVKIDEYTTSTLIFTNNGSAPTQITGFNSTNNIFTIDTAFPLTINPGDYSTIIFRFSPKNTGLENGTISIISDAEDNPSLDIIVDGTGYQPAMIVVNPTLFEVDITQNEMVTQ